MEKRLQDKFDEPAPLKTILQLDKNIIDKITKTAVFMIY